MLSDVTTARVAGYLMHKRASTAASTTNVVRKILAGFFKRAVANNRLRENPVSPVKPFKAQKGEKTKRRSFTIDELKEIYAKAPDDFWRYMIVGGAYTGLRMGDLICMKWGNVDLQTNFLKIEPDKVEGKEISIPIRPAFRSILANLKASAGKVKPADYLWPEQAAKHARYVSKSGYFSNQFYNTILEPCGLVPKREVTHKKKENSTGKRQVNDISFHCLRHFFISTLKATGSNQAVAKALAGHSSDQVNDLYTHVPEAQLTIAINQLPEFVK
jgi:integrase